MTIEQRAVSRDLRSFLTRAVSSLPAIYREAFVLREVEGLSNKEVSELLGVSRTVVKVRLFRAKRRLRRELERLTGDGAAKVLEFAGDRCDRMVAGVMARIAEI